MLHQGVGHLAEPLVPFLGQLGGGRLQGAGQPALFLLERGGPRRLDAAAQPLLDADDRLPRPGAGVVLGDVLLRLLLDHGEHARQGVAGRRLHVAAGEVGEARGHGFGAQVRVGLDAGDGRLQFRHRRRLAGRAPFIQDALATAAGRQPQEQAAREPHGVGAEAAERAGADGLAQPALVEPDAQRRRQLVEEVAAQVGHGVALAFRCAVVEGEQVDGVERGAVVGQARAVGPVLRREGDRRVGKVVQLHQGGEQVGLLGARGGRVVRRPTEQERRDRGVAVAHLLEQAARGVTQVGQEAAAAAARRPQHVDARHVVAERQARLADAVVNRVGVAGMLDFFLEVGQDA